MDAQKKGADGSLFHSPSFEATTIKIRKKQAKIIKSQPISRHPQSNMNSPETVPPADVSLSTAFWYWLKLGFISFGGPAGQIAIMHTELVERKKWIGEQRFLHADKPARCGSPPEWRHHTSA